MPDASQTTGNIEIDVKPGIVLISFTTMPWSGETKKSTRARPAPSIASNARIAVACSPASVSASTSAGQTTRAPSRLKAGDVTMWATTTLMDLVGPYAQSTECPLEKWFRDAKIYQLFEGTAEIQRMVISRMQAREYAERLGYAAEVAAEAAKKEPVAA